MINKLIKRMFLASSLVVLMLTGCSTMGDKNQPPPPAAPPVEAAAPMPAPAPEPEPAPMPEPEPEVIVLEGVHFDFDKDTLKPSGAAILDNAVTVMQRNPDIQFSIDGHTDSIGSDQYNDDLGMRRANTVRNYLVQHGVSSSRLVVNSYGENNPVASNSTDEGRAMNRRVEIAPR